jgi:hypothetical protein
VRFCRHCARMVRGTKRLGVLSWLLIVLFSGVTLGFFLLVFLPYFFFVKAYSCPICGATDLARSAPPNAVGR